MSIDYNTIMTSSSEEVEEYINRNHFTDKQKLEIYSFYNRNRKDKITVNVKILINFVDNFWFSFWIL